MKNDKMSNIKMIAKRILIELEEVKNLENTAKTEATLTLVNEALRDAVALAQEILEDEQKAA